MAGRRFTHSHYATRSSGQDVDLSLSYDYRDRSVYSRSLRPDLFVIFNYSNCLFFDREVQSGFAFDYEW